MCLAKRRVRQDIFTKERGLRAGGHGATNTNAAKQLWQGCGPGRTYGDDDTCAGYTSQSRAPRHEHGGRHNNPMERPCPPPSEKPLNTKCEVLHPHRPLVRILSFGGRRWRILESSIWRQIQVGATHCTFLSMSMRWRSPLLRRKTRRCFSG